MGKLFDEFLIEKEYVCGLSKLTLQSYRVMWRTFKRLVENPPVSRSTFLAFVKAAIDEGLQPKSINTHISTLNSFLTWLRENGQKPDKERRQVRLFEFSSAHS